MKRTAFTLVELLVVITIIGILAGLIAAAAIPARRAANRAAITMEINQLDMACKAFKEKLGDYPPDFADVDRVKAKADVVRFIARAFPRCTRLPINFQNAATDLPAEYNPGTALAFWLGGDRDADGNFIGFSADPSNPFDVDAVGAPLTTKCPSRIQPFYDFNRERMVAWTWQGCTPVPCRSYWPQGTTPESTTQGAGFFYFRNDNGNYATKGWLNVNRGAIRDGRVTGTVWLNPQSFQIRCCGLDGRWWSDAIAATGQWPDVFGVVATGAKQNSENFDDQGNFCTGTLEDSFAL